MTDVNLDEICPEDILRILLPAKQIPNGSMVSKKNGAYTYTLTHSLKAYPESVKSGEERGEMIEIKGLFLHGNRGNINQVKPDTELHWHVDAEWLVDHLQRRWDGPEQ